MAHAVRNEITIPVFDGAEYTNWKTRMLKFLQYRGCLEQVKREKRDNDGASWDEKDVQATNYIYSAISNKQLEYISDIDSSYKILQKFDNMYLKKSTALQIVCRNNIENIKLNNYSDVDTFFNEFEKSVNELKQAGAVISEQEKLNYMLKALPSTYSHMGDLLDVLPEKDRTVDFLKSKIKLKNMENKHPKVEVSNVFGAESRSSSPIKCFLCGKIGHKQKNCWQRFPNYRGGQSFSTSRGHGFTNFSNRGYNHRGYSNTGFSQGRGNRGVARGRARGASYQPFSAERHKSENMTFMCESEQNVNHGQSSDQIVWCVDSGCSDHLINSTDYFIEYIKLSTPRKISAAKDGISLDAIGIGNIKVKCYVGNKETYCSINNVYYVPDLRKNLLSVSKMESSGLKVVFQKGKVRVYNYEQLKMIGNLENNLYTIEMYVDKQMCNYSMGKDVNNDLLQLWHRRYGHLGMNNINTLVKRNLVNGLNELENLKIESSLCEPCILGKMTRQPFNGTGYRARKPLEIVHTDVCGPIVPESREGYKYFVTFIDDYTHFVMVYLMKHKSEVFEKFKQYYYYVTNHFDMNLLTLKSDNGGEYTSREYQNFCYTEGITFQYTVPYNPEMNGVAERMNRTLMEKARTMLINSGLSKEFWGDAILCSAYLTNRSPTVNKDRTPAELFYGEKPNVWNLKVFGSTAYNHIPKEQRQKLDPKAKKLVMIGYSLGGYKLWDEVNKKVVIGRNVTFDEMNQTTEKVVTISEPEEIKQSPYSSEIDIKHDKEESNESDVNNENRDEDENTKTEIESLIERKNNDDDDKRGDADDKTISDKRISKRRIKPPVRFHEEYGYNCICANYCDAMTPVNFQEAIMSDNAGKWKSAMNREMDCLAKNNTWTLVSKPKDKKVLDVKWVYKKKSDDVYKARLVVRGFQQTNCIEDTYSPVAKMQTLKLLLSYCCQSSLEIEQMDVETAFLNGEVISEVYVKQPDGYEDDSDRVYKLNKALYGLKESPRSWYECFNNFIISLGFRRSKYDYCLYVKEVNNLKVYILLFVDDLLICCKNKNIITEIKNKLSTRFIMKDMGKVKNYIGIDIEYNYTVKNIMKLSQKTYIESLAKLYKIENSKLYKTPMEINLKLDQSEANENFKYRNLIGALLYISSGTRPDVSFSVNYLSRYQNCYNETFFKYALRVLKYLYLTKDLCLTYYKNDKVDIVDCYVDADWAGDIVDRKSTTGYCIRLFGNVIYWKSKKQNCVTKSSTFAEYIALSEAVTEINLVINILNDMFVEIKNPVKMYEDNSGALAIAKYGNFTKNSKHIEVQYHYVNESYKNGIIEIVKIDSENNISDIFTKSLGNVKFIKFRSMLKLI